MTAETKEWRSAYASAYYWSRKSSVIRTVVYKKDGQWYWDISWGKWNGEWD